MRIIENILMDFVFWSHIKYFQKTGLSKRVAGKYCRTKKLSEKISNCRENMRNTTTIITTITITIKVTITIPITKLLKPTHHKRVKGKSLQYLLKPTKKKQRLKKMKKNKSVEMVA